MNLRDSLEHLLSHESTNTFKQRALVEVPDSVIPKGYTVTGEYREPTEDDCWISAAGVATSGPNGWPRVIIKYVGERGGVA